MQDILFGETEDYSVNINSPTANITWDGDVNSQWSNPLNWDGDVVPDDTNPVIIPGGLTNYPNFNGAMTVGVSFGPLSCQSLVILNGGSVTITGTGAIALFGDVFVYSGGALNVNVLTVGSGGALYINGGDVSVNNECIMLNNGNMNGGSLSVGGKLEFTPGTTWSCQWWDSILQKWY